MLGRQRFRYRKRYGRFYRRWLAMNDLETMATVFDRYDNEIHVDPDIGARAMVPLRRMLDFARDLQVQVRGDA